MSNDFDVVIVGAGPVGLVAANLLGQQQIKTLLIEKNDAIFTFPRAIGIDDEALRSLQHIGFTEDEIKSLCITPTLEYFSSSGYRSFQPDPTVKPYGYSILSTYLQPHLESQLLQKLNECSSVTVWSSHDFIGYKNLDSSIQVKINNPDQNKVVNCKFLLGCDGGRSDVRKSMGAFLVGETQQENWLVVDLYDSDEIRQNIKSCKLKSHGKRALVTINLPKNLRRFETRLDFEEFNAGMLSEDKVVSILKPWLGEKKVDIVRSQVYERYFRISNKFSEENVFLLGDAAHLLPPYGGQGMCSGIKDAVNLSWKIIQSIHFENYSFLKSYEIERREQITEIMNFIKALSVNVEGDKCKSDIPENISTSYYRKLKPLPCYKSGFLMSSKHAGILLPQPRVMTSDGIEKLLDNFLGKSFSIIGVNCFPHRRLSVNEQAFWKKLNCEFVSLKLHGRTSCDLNSFDVTMLSLKERDSFFSTLDSHIVVVRPDRYIFTVCHKNEIKEMTHKIKQIFMAESIVC